MRRTRVPEARVKIRLFQPSIRITQTEKHSPQQKQKTPNPKNNPYENNPTQTFSAGRLCRAVAGRTGLPIRTNSRSHGTILLMLPMGLAWSGEREPWLGTEPRAIPAGALLVTVNFNGSSDTPASDYICLAGGNPWWQPQSVDLTNIGPLISTSSGTTHRISPWLNSMMFRVGPGHNEQKYSPTCYAGLGGRRLSFRKSAGAGYKCLRQLQSDGALDRQHQHTSRSRRWLDARQHSRQSGPGPLGRGQRHRLP